MSMRCKTGSEQGSRVCDIGDAASDLPDARSDVISPVAAGCVLNEKKLKIFRHGFSLIF